MTEPVAYSISAIGTITSPFKQKFAIPRQPALANAKGSVVFTPEFNDANGLRGIETYSHLWLLFLFHENLAQSWTPTVRAPRLGGNSRIGVFASRSTFRPNGIGMSVVKNLGHEQKHGQLILHVGGLDLLDGTPVIDIKPYLPYSDSVDDASARLLEQNPLPQREVVFTDAAQTELNNQPHTDLAALIQQCLGQDPRPAYRQAEDNDPKTYQVIFYDRDIHWQVTAGQVVVTAIKQVAV
ncbi:tRNA (N6-threonylcarbamoyladenosine(37)-N6)-methyltransferase TrmO [Alteromonas lipolytica]|uniref:tRNA (N6-threonylcarbamoyladenosine(37)-N6)-methyltransferase TrmO n=1 Tax=Alteromonas lipolytica TaxID=1856405 RepID=A0A1E8F9G7_9ALTE|nr:tRNA (N6-threonylcarbamoyladenosine(37)-N6)-methyltransferase TrmO [Alteromonas lipolytica]OFI32554.1 tRNA (N6-threonylcarbamoyladenosine(37)-N6)-methyltransferase TrmO [Alteromonas lipolytica]GGF75159.1 tRNA (N6-threonylcarbamoyladenosine(37)-N6)-methyltransferase TrmO [Alteromonas lipolytica]